MDRFAYIVDASELSDLRTNWPAGVSVALCLDAEGAALLVLFENEEAENLPQRISAATGWDAGSFAVSPEIAGCPTLRPLFSQAQHFTHMVSGARGLDRMARAFCGEAEDEPDAGSPDQKEEARHASRLNLSLPKDSAELPDGYRNATQWSGTAAFLDAEVRVAGGCVRVVVAPSKVGRRERAVRAHSVGFRDDLRCFVLCPDVLGKGDPAKGAIVDIPENRFPPSLVSRLTARGASADVTVTSEGIFVAPHFSASSPQRPPRRPSRRTLQATLVIGVAMGLFSGSIVSALQRASYVSSDMLSYRAASGHSALNVLESFARAMDREEEKGANS